jgi:[ribosomal protein S5]-alanine N-acetyltransferase
MIIPKSHIIETNRLLLKIASLDDIPFVYSATHYKGFNDGMLWDKPESPEELIKPHEDLIKAWEEDLSYSFSIIKKSDQLLTGRISIRKTSEGNTWNIGFWTHPQHQNQGYMSEATSAIIKFGFSTLGAEKIIACHALWNKASEKVLKKNGMVFLEYLEKGFQKNGEWVEENLLEIKKADWKG